MSQGEIMHAASIRISKMQLLVLATLLILLSAALSSAQTLKLPAAKIYAQKLVNEALGSHSDIMGLEISAVSVGKEECTTIASDEELGIGEKCDEDELAVMKSNKLVVDKTTEHAQEFFDVNVPIHDPSGKVIAIVGVDFKPDPKQTSAQASARAQQIAKEIEAKVKSKEQLYEQVN
jgi:hypothetical protein